MRAQKGRICETSFNGMIAIVKTVEKVPQRLAYQFIVIALFNTQVLVRLCSSASPSSLW